MKFLAALGGLLFYSCFCGAADCPRLKAYGNPEYAPYLWRMSGQNSQMAGANVDFIKAISKEIKIPIDVAYGGTWARVQEEARYGRVDIVLGAFHNKVREAYLDYLRPPLHQTRTVIWVRENDKLMYRQWSDLKGLRGVTVINNSFGQKFDEHAKDHLQVTFVASLQQAFDMLKNNRVRYLIYEEWPAKSYIARYKVQGLKSLDPSVADEQLYLVLSKKSRCNDSSLRQKIEEALGKFAKQNLMTELLKQNSQRWDEITIH